MHYPADMTAEDIMEFEYEYNRYLDRQDPNSLIAVNEELQLIANEERDMSMRDLMIDLQDEIRLGVLSFAEIAQKYEVPTSWVQEAWDELCEQEAEAEQFAGYHDELERDHDEAYEPDYGDNWYDEQYELEDF
jgi:hypothetical protein